MVLYPRWLVVVLGNDAVLSEKQVQRETLEVVISCSRQLPRP